MRSVAIPARRRVEDLSVADAVDWGHLARQTMDDESLAREVLGLFLDQSQALLKGVREARDASARADAAHTLKGSARAVGAFAVAEAAGRVEGLPAFADDGVLLEAIAGLHAAVAEARSAIASRLPGGSVFGL